VTDPFCEGQIVTVFRSRLREDADPRYEALDSSLRARAAELGGLIEVKSFVADDGERATLVTFTDRASHERWANDDEHRAAQRLGRSSVYAEFSIQVTECLSAWEFTAPD
jgi:heme-degrading monooxygenase HmoA